MPQTRLGNLVTALQAVAELARIDPLKRGVDGRSLGSSALGSGACHPLHLRSIDTRKSARTLPVECDRLSVLSGHPVSLDQRFTRLFEEAFGNGPDRAP